VTASKECPKCKTTQEVRPNIPLMVSKFWGGGGSEFSNE